MSRFSFPESAPEAQGIPSSAIEAFLVDVQARKIDLHSLMIVRNGYRVAQGWWRPYDPSLSHYLYSLTKSFTSAAAGFAISEGRFGLDDRVVSFFPDELPGKVSDHLAEMRVRHLLTMSGGFESDQMQPISFGERDDWVRRILAVPVTDKPGEVFRYNSGGSHLISAIVQATTGQRIQDYLEPRLFRPLGIGAVQWWNCPMGMSIGGFGLKLRTEDIARFGLTILQNGRFNGAQVVPEQWVRLATSRHISSGADPNIDWAQGYGFQFWRCRRNAFRGDGAFGQYCVMMPDQNAVVVITSGVRDMQEVLDLVWDHLLSAMKPQPLAEDAGAASKLEERLDGLTLDGPAGAALNATARRVNGRTFRIASDQGVPEDVRFEFTETGSRIATIRDGKSKLLSVGPGQWINCGVETLDDMHGVFYARGAWTGESVYSVRYCLAETPHCADVNYEFGANDELVVTTRLNVSFGPVERPVRRGRLRD